MISSDDEENLRRAIELSLEDAPASSSSKNIVDLTSDLEDDEDDEDLRRAIAMSLHENPKGLAYDSAMGPQNGPSRYASSASVKGEQIAQPEEEVLTTPLSQSLNAFGIPGLNRRALEQERIARLRKRKRSTSPDRPSKLVPREPVVQPTEPKSNELPKPHYIPGIQYPKGTFKRTWAYQHPRTNDIRLEEIFQTSTLKIAVLSSFQFEDIWLFNKINPFKIKHYWIMSAKGDDVQEKLNQELIASGNTGLKLHFPPMHGQIHSMHSKLMLLFNKDHLRVVVPTANMIQPDWGETGRDPMKVGTWQPAVMENSLFLIDLPRHPEHVLPKQLETSFGKELVSFLEAQKVTQNVIDGLGKFDFSGTSGFAFVHSIGGSHSDGPSKRTGLHSLARSVRQLGLDQVETLELDYAASALGNLKEAFLKQIYQAACGLSPLKEDAPRNFLDHFRIYFPSHDAVKNSTGGVECGGIINLSRDHYHSQAFPRKCLRDHKSTRPGVLSHNKLLLARGRKKDGTPFAWAYVGSHNASEAAWGSQKILKNGKEGALSIRNWECGVLVPVPAARRRGQDAKDGGVPPMSVFEGTVEVPFEFPGARLEEPWFFRG